MSEIDWEKIRKDAQNISVEQAIRIIQSVNDQRRLLGDKTGVLDIDTLLKVREMRAAVARGEGEKYDTSVEEAPPDCNRFAVVDAFHPDKPGCIVAYEDAEGNIIEEVPETAPRSEVLRIRKAKETQRSPGEAKEALIRESEFKETAKDGGDDNSGSSSS